MHVIVSACLRNTIRYYIQLSVTESKLLHTQRKISKYEIIISFEFYFTLLLLLLLLYFMAVKSKWGFSFVFSGSEKFFSQKYVYTIYSHRYTCPIFNWALFYVWPLLVRDEFAYFATTSPLPPSTIAMFLCLILLLLLHRRHITVIKNRGRTTKEIHC